MKVRFTYGNGVLTLPAAVMQHIDKATKRDIRVLLALAAEPMACVDLAVARARVAAALSVSEGEVEGALGFWRGTGILTVTETESEPCTATADVQVPVTVTEAPAAKPAPKVIADGGLPSYSTEELTGVLERRKGLSALIDECQRVMGKVFNTREINLIAGMLDYLEMSEEYILLLLSHCVRMEKKSIRYVEKMALSLHDEGVVEASDLEERLQHIEMMAGSVGKIRKMFGASSRALTTKEKRMVEKWICTMKYSDEIIQMAYEITVDATGDASFPYANSILERWFAEGYRTVEDINNALTEYRRKKNNPNSSFDVDEFFEAALKRTYGDAT